MSAFRVVPAVLAVFACTSGGGEGGITDDAGVPLDTARRAARVVSLAPPLTELVFALGAGEHLVGRSTYDSFPPQAASVPDVGAPLPPNLETILARQPDLVLFYASTGNAGALSRLQDLGIATLSVRMDRLESVQRAAAWLGAVLDRSAEAAGLRARLDRELDSLRSSAGAGAGRGAILTWDNPPIVIGRGSFLTELLELAGARNAFDDLAEPSVQVTIESIAQADPDFLLVIGDSTRIGWARRPEWQVVPAVRDRRFVFVDGTAYAWPSPRAPEAVATLRRQLDRFTERVR